MESIVLQTQDISMKYKDDYALQNVNITLRQGHIYGFIGENGAGKSTLLKIISGLVFPTGGQLAIYGKTNLKDLEQARRRIGSTIEAPALYPNYSAAKNLDMQRILVGNPDRSVIDKVLKLMSLSDCGSKKVRNFSMGMKQRLGIGMCLVGNPDILILDEPVNGLDPRGIADLRKILLKLNQERDMTILISSHILNELYLLVTDYIIIHKGKILETLTHEALDQKCQKHITLRTDDAYKVVPLLENQLHTQNFKVLEDGTIHLYEYTDDISAVAKVLRDHQILVTQMALSEQTLEEYYLSVAEGSYQNHAQSS